MKGAAKSGMEVEKSCRGLYISIIRYIKYYNCHCERRKSAYTSNTSYISTPRGDHHGSDRDAKELKRCPPSYFFVCRKYLRFEACRQQGLDPASRGNLHVRLAEGRKGVAAIGGF